MTRDPTWPPATCCTEFYRCYCGNDWGNVHRVPRSPKAYGDPEFPNACGCAYCVSLGERRGWQFAPPAPDGWVPNERTIAAIRMGA